MSDVPLSKFLEIRSLYKINENHEKLTVPCNTVTLRLLKSIINLKFVTGVHATK